MVKVVSKIFGQGSNNGWEFFQVPALHPRELPPANIIKIDTEGVEAKIVEYADWSAASLLLTEYHFAHHLRAIKTQLESEFVPILEQEFAYTNVVSMASDYQKSLVSDYFGL